MLDDLSQSNDDDVRKCFSQTRSLSQTGLRKSVQSYDSLSSSRESNIRQHSIPIVHQFSRRNNRLNISFSNDRFFEIQKENQRLLSKLTALSFSKSKSRTLPTSATACRLPVAVPTLGAMSRHREQLRIEAENKNISKRLASVQPSIHLRWSGSSANVMKLRSQSLPKLN